MSQTLREALMKAGLNPSEKRSPKKEEKKTTIVKNDHREHKHEGRQDFNRSRTYTNKSDSKHIDHQKDYHKKEEEHHSDHSKRFQLKRESGDYRPKQNSTSSSHTPSRHSYDGERHPQSRNFCGACRKTSPDVEFYRHTIRGLSANWLCCMCADKYRIADSCRLTNQSDTAQKRLFRREYGATKRYGFPANPDLTPNYLLQQRRVTEVPRKKVGNDNNDENEQD